MAIHADELGAEAGAGEIGVSQNQFVAMPHRLHHMQQVGAE